MFLDDFHLARGEELAFLAVAVACRQEFLHQVWMAEDECLELAQRLLRLQLREIPLCEICLVGHSFFKFTSGLRS